MFLTNSVFLESGHSFRSPISDNTNAASRRLHGITVKAYFFHGSCTFVGFVATAPPKKRKPQDHEMSFTLHAGEASEIQLSSSWRIQSHCENICDRVKLDSFPYRGEKFRHISNVSSSTIAQTSQLSHKTVP